MAGGLQDVGAVQSRPRRPRPGAGAGGSSLLLGRAGPGVRTAGVEADTEGRTHPGDVKEIPGIVNVKMREVRAKK